MECTFIVLLIWMYGERVMPLVQGDNQADIMTSDFDDIVYSKTFVDKTLLIKEIFKSPHHANLILAPRKFGKSTNLHMIKRFCEFEIDGYGDPRPIMVGTNFALFQGNKLKIFSDLDFLGDHFASFPVLYLDYSCLYNIESYEDLTEKLMAMISETFSQHKYLLQNDSLWSGFEKGLFKSYIRARENLKDHNTHILTSLKWLCEILYVNFNRKVLVLIDNYDAYVYSGIFKDSKGIDKVLKLMIEIDGNLLRPSKDIAKVILTGTLKIFREDFGKNVRTYNFLEDNPLSPYYGLTGEQLNLMLSKIFKSAEEREEMNKTIMNYYGSYKLYGEKDSITEIYNIWSVVNFILHREHMTDYLCMSEFIPGFKTMMKAQAVKVQLQALVLGEAVHVDRTSPLTEENIRTLNYIITSYICPPAGVEVFLRLIYSLGYLTPVKENKGPVLEEFKVPNSETHNELLRYTPC